MRRPLRRPEPSAAGTAGALWLAVGASLASGWASAEPAVATDAPPAASPSAPSVAAPPAAEASPGAHWAARGAALAARGEIARALAAYGNALRDDPSLGEAYLGLAELRARMGDLAEAELLCTRAVHLPGSTSAALAERALVRRRRGDLAEALADLEAATRAPDAPREQLLLLTDWYVERRAWAAALAIGRRLATIDDGALDPRARAEAAVRLQALIQLAGDADPVTSPPPGPTTWERRSFRALSTRPSATALQGEGARQVAP